MAKMRTLSGAVISLLALTVFRGAFAEDIGPEDDLISFASESELFRPAGARRAMLVALIRSQSSPHSAMFHPTLHAIKDTLRDAGLPQMVGYVDLDDALSSRLSKVYAIRTIPAVLLFLEHSPDPVRLAYLVNKTAPEYVQEVLEFIMRTRSLSSLPQLPAMNLTSAIANLTKPPAAPVASVPVAADGQTDAAQPEPAAPVNNTTLDELVGQLDKQLELVNIVQRRLQRAKVLAQEISANGLGPAVQSYNSARNRILAASGVMDKQALAAALEELGAVGDFIPQLY